MCNNCQNTTCYQCNQQAPCVQNDCSCPVKDLSTDCVLYTGSDLSCSGIKNGTILTDLIQQLDEFICTFVTSSFENAFTLLSIGNGEDIYSGLTLQGEKKIRTIQTSNLGVEGVEILAPIDFDAQDGLVIPAKRLNSETLFLIDNGDSINVEVPGSTTIKTFYVDPFSTSSEETGSRAKPFKTLNAAIAAFIDAPNGGTILSPYYANIGKIELLNNVNVFDMGYISVNKLNIEGNGFNLNYYGTQDYFISTAYLVGLDPKSISGKLDYEIKITLNNVGIIGVFTNKIIHNLAYTSPTVSGFQNTSGMSITNCRFYDITWATVNNSAYVNTGQTHFGVPVYAQNTIPGNQYLIKSENSAWFGDGTFTLNNCKIYPTTSSALYYRNTSSNHIGLSIEYQYVRRNYSTLVGSTYNPSTTVSNITVENDYLTNPIGRSTSWLRVENYVETNHQAPAGGQSSIFKALGDSTIIVEGGNFYIETPNNLVEINSQNSFIELRNLNASSVYPQDSTFGAFKYIGVTPLATQKYIWVDGSTIRNVKVGTPTTDYILPSADSATINGAMYNTLPSFPNDTAALAAGLIINCIYFNTTTNSLTKIQ